MVESSSAQFGTALAQETGLLEQFCHLLKKEQSLLLAGQTSPLMVLAEEKTLLANQLMTQCSLRRGLYPTLPSLPVAMAAQLDTLQQRAAEAEHLNRTNGELIHIRLRHNQQALNILQQASHQATLYGPDGHTQTAFTGGRPLAQG